MIVVYITGMAGSSVWLPATTKFETLPGMTLGWEFHINLQVILFKKDEPWKIHIF